MDLLLKKANELNDMDLYYELEKWNLSKDDNPLDLLNHEWMKSNAMIESDELYSLVITIGKELSYEHSILVCMVLSDYGVVYAKMALAEYYEENGFIDKAIKIYEELINDFECERVAKKKLRELKKEKLTT